MDFDSANLLGEIEDFLENAPPLSSRCPPGNSAVPGPVTASTNFPKSAMTAATKAALGEHLRNHLGAAEKRKLDEHGFDSSSLPKAQKLDDEEDLAYLLDSATGDKADVFGEEQQHAQSERKSQGILAQVLMDKKGIRSQNNVESRSLEMANRHRMDADGFSNSPEDILVMRKINEIVKNPGLDNQRRSAEVTKIMHENPNARRLLARLKSKKGTKNMSLASENGLNEDNGSQGTMSDMNGQQHFNGFNTSANDLLESGNHLAHEGDHNQQWVYNGQQQQGKMLQQTNAQRSNYMGQQYPMANKQMCSMETGGMFPPNGSIDANGGIWNHDSQFVSPRGMMQQQHGPPPYPYGVGSTGAGVLMRNPGMDLHLTQQMSHNGPMNYPISHQNEFVMNGQNVSMRAPSLVQRRIHPGLNEYHHHHSLNPGFGGHVMQNGMMVQQGMKLSNFNEAGGMFNGDCVPTRGMLVNPGTSSPVRHPRAAVGGGMPMNAIAKVGSPHMSPHMQSPQMTGYQGIINEFPYQHQPQEQQHFHYGGFAEGNLHRMNGGGMTTSASNDMGFVSNQQSDAFGATSITGRMQQNQFYKEFEEETKKVMQENGDFHPNESLAQMASWRLSPDSQFYHNDLRRRLKDAVAALENAALVAEAMKFEEDAFNNCDSMEAYSTHIVQWLASVYQRSEVKGAALDQQPPPTSTTSGLPDINVQDMGGSSSNISLAAADNTRDTGSIVAEEYNESVKSATNSPSPKPFLSEQNPILSKLLPSISHSSNDPQSSESSSVDSAVSSGSPPPSSLPSAISSTAASVNNSSKSSFGEGNFQSPNTFPVPNTFEETKSPPSSSTMSSGVANAANGLPRGARRTSGKNQVNNPYSVDSGFGSPRSNTSSSLCSPKIQGTSPILLPISESSPEK